jgi:hypothetical protein
MPQTGSFSQEIEAISNAFPAVLDCATCGTPQPMKIDLLAPLRAGDPKITAYRCDACGAIRDRLARLAGRRQHR